MLIQDVLKVSHSVVAAWLPGTTGGHAVVNALFGKYRFRADIFNKRVNTLPIPWLSHMDNIKNFPVYDGKGIPTIQNALFESGFGLSTRKWRHGEEEEEV